MQEKPSQVTYLSEWKSKRLPPSQTSVSFAGTLAEKERQEAAHRLLTALHKESRCPYDLIFLCALVAASSVQALENKGFKQAPWLMADLYERMMRYGQDQAGS